MPSWWACRAWWLEPPNHRNRRYGETKTLAKNVIEFTLDNEGDLIQGAMVCQRPEDRIHRNYRRNESRDIGIELNNQPRVNGTAMRIAPSMDPYDCEVRLLKAPLQRLACKSRSL